MHLVDLRKFGLVDAPSWAVSIPFFGRGAVGGTMVDEKLRFTPRRPALVAGKIAARERGMSEPELKRIIRTRCLHTMFQNTCV